MVLDDKYLNDIEKDLPIMPDEWRNKLKNTGTSQENAELLLLYPVLLKLIVSLGISRGHLRRMFKELQIGVLMK